MKITAKVPWKNTTGDIPMHLSYPQGTMYDSLEQIAKKYPQNIAFDFMGRSVTYQKMINEINTCAKALKTIGIREGDKVTIALPNCPQAIYIFYAINLVGAIANMIHPLSAENEIKYFFNLTKSEYVVAVDLNKKDYDSYYKISFF